MNQTSRYIDHWCPVCACPVPLVTNPDVATRPDEVEPEARARWAAFLAERCPNGPHDVSLPEVDEG